MNDLDMSRPGTELFPEPAEQYSNSYTDVNRGQVVEDPLNTGVNEQDAAGQPMSDKEMNFRALREETAKLQSEREYWRGQAEALSKSRQPEPTESTQADAFSALDWEDGRDVRKAFDALREQNNSLRSELKDAIVAISTKTQHQDWDNLVTQHVPQLTNKNPIFAEMIRNTSNPYEAAYLLAELSARATQPVTPAPMSQNAQRAITNAAKPQPLASIGGRGSLSQADYYANMSDKDFMEVAARNMANI
jgi:hypothetical protein